MRHVVLTRSAYGPEWALEANRRRLAITRAVTARLMARQIHRDWTWVVLLDERDRLLEERLAVFRDAAPAFHPLLWQPKAVSAAPWDKTRNTYVQKVAATAYRANWRDAIGTRDAPLLQTRLDDDDGLTPDALLRTVLTAHQLRKRTVLMQPWGFRVFAGRQSKVRHASNAMHSLFTPAGDDLVIYDYGHTHVRRVAPIVTVDTRPAWLWVRHPDTISGWKRADRPITAGLRRLFPIDWSVV